MVQAATVTAKQVETGLTRTSDYRSRAGTICCSSCRWGITSLEVTAKGFQKYARAGILLNVNETATVPVRLLVGAETQRVQVQADAELIQPSVTSLGKPVLEHEMLDLPLDGRNFAQLGLSAAGSRAPDCRASSKREALCAMAKPIRSTDSGRSRTTS